ncbi:hypothetical protein D3C84_604670 [compost metagenome]
MDPAPGIGVAEAIDQPGARHYREGQAAQRADAQGVQRCRHRQRWQQPAQPEQQQADGQPGVAEQQHQQVRTFAAMPGLPAQQADRREYAGGDQQPANQGFEQRPGQQIEQQGE